MEVRTGFKKTELGVFPVDWEVRRLGQLSEFITSGSRGWAKHYSARGPIFVRSQNIRDGRLDLTDQQCVIPPAGAEGSRTRLQDSDLLVTITGNSVGNVAWVKEDIGEAYISQHVGLVRLSDPSMAEYVCLFLTPGSPGNSQIWASQAGQSKPGLNLKNLEDFLVALPSCTEQRVIATALRDVGSLISGLDRLIAKKCDLKQAAMQQLLTGRWRLPGFNGDWKVCRLGLIGEISGAGVDKKSRPNELTVRLLNYMDVYKKDFIKSEDLWHEVTARPDKVRRCTVQRGDIFFTPTSEVREDIGRSAVATEDIPDAVYSYHVVRLRLYENWDTRFRSYVFKSKEFLDQASAQCEGSGTRYVITLPKFRAMTIQFPLDVNEQSAIATALSDMDAELAALEARRDKAIALKQGMMRELLTGRTRLLADGGNHDA